MGHRQQMTDKQRLKWDVMQYKARLSAKRGHNYPYLTDELYKDLERKGYKIATFHNCEETTSESIAIDLRNTYRNAGYQSKIVCISNDLRIKTYRVYYKPKK